LNNLRHIFFDLDHTLWDFEANSLETLAEIYKDHALGAMGAERSENFFLDRYVHHNERMWAMYRENRMSKSRLRSARFEAALRDLGVENKRLAKKIGNDYLDRCPRKTRLKEGAIEIVQALSEHYTLSILSNGFHETQLTKLDVSGLAPYFDEVITSERASAKKPNPRIFTFALQLTGAHKDEVCMIGDNLDIDVKGAVDSGWKAVHFNDRTDERADGVTTVHRLADLKPLFLEAG
jgi:putative hydrolase of the HAD superfamily